MPTSSDDGRVWGRPEAIDSIGRVPGRQLRVVVTVLGLIAIGFGIYLGTQVVVNASPVQQQTAAPDGPAVVTTCASVPLSLKPGQFPPEVPLNKLATTGVLPGRVVRIYSADSDGKAQMLVPQAFVLAATPDTAKGTLQVEVLIRSGPNDTVLAQLNGANAKGSLSINILYDVNVKPAEVRNSCRNG